MHGAMLKPWTETNILRLLRLCTFMTNLGLRVQGKSACFYLPQGIRRCKARKRQTTRHQKGKTAFGILERGCYWQGRHCTSLHSSRKKNSKQNIACPLCLQKPSPIGPAIQSVWNANAFRESYPCSTFSHETDVSSPEEGSSLWN